MQFCLIFKQKPEVSRKQRKIRIIRFLPTELSTVSVDVFRLEKALATLQPPKESTAQLAGPMADADNITAQQDGKRGHEVIADYLKTLDSSPGVYRMLDAESRVLYVGKARSLKARVANYTQVNQLRL